MPECFQDRSMENSLREEERSCHEDHLNLYGLFEKMQVTTYSTAFSGVDSPGTSFAMLQSAAATALDEVARSPEHINAVDA